MAELLFNNGEGVEHADLNNLQRLLLRDVLQNYLYSRDFRRMYSSAVPFRPVRESLHLVATGGMGVSLSTMLNQAKSVIIAEIADPGAPDQGVLVHEHEGSVAFTAPAADPSLPRWDIIEARITRADGSSETRDFKDATTGAVTSQTVNKRRRTVFSVAYRQGTPNATPAEPTVTAGYVKLARIEVPAGATSIAATNLVDFRTPLGGQRLHVPNAWGISNMVGTSPGSLGFSLETVAGGFGNWYGLQAEGRLMIPLVLPYGASGTQSANYWQRLGMIRMSALLASGTSPSVLLKRRASLNSYSSADTEVADLTSQVTYGSGTVHQLSVPSSVGALWLTGARNLSGNLDGFLYLEITEPSNATGSLIKAVSFDVYGE